METDCLPETLVKKQCYCAITFKAKSPSRPESAKTSDARLPEARATRKAVLTDKHLREEEEIGSKTPLCRQLELREGPMLETRTRTLALFKANALTTLETTLS